MKPSDVQSQAVIMCGISGSGKTRYARCLEGQGYVRLSTDALIWEKAGPELQNLSKQALGALFKECGQEVRSQLAKLLKSGKKVVVDATNCRRSVRDEIRHLCAGAEVKPIFIYCTAEKDELLRRLSLRKGEGPDDLIVSREDLYGYWDGFERPQDDEEDFYDAELPGEIVE